MKKDIDKVSHCVNMWEYFYFKESNLTYLALVFEKLGKSLYDIIKNNKYRGKLNVFLLQDILFILFNNSRNRCSKE